jgi:hypothetical protein
MTQASIAGVSIKSTNGGTGYRSPPCPLTIRAQPRPENLSEVAPTSTHTPTRVLTHLLPNTRVEAAISPTRVLTAHTPPSPSSYVRHPEPCAIPRRERRWWRFVAEMRPKNDASANGPDSKKRTAHKPGKNGRRFCRSGRVVGKCLTSNPATRTCVTRASPVSQHVSKHT